MSAFHDEQGKFSSARVLSLGGFVAAVGFGIGDAYGWHVTPPVWTAIYLAMGGGTLGQVGPRMAQYFQSSATTSG